MKILPPFPPPLSDSTRRCDKPWADAKRAEHAAQKATAAAARVAIADALLFLSERIGELEPTK